MFENGYGTTGGGFELNKYIRDPFTGNTFTLKEWELEKQRRKEQMAREYHEHHIVIRLHLNLILQGGMF